MNKNFGWYLTAILIVLLVGLEFFVLPGEYVVLKSIAIAILSIFVIVKASDFTIDSISHYAKATGISNFLIGFLVIGIVTSLPDVSAAVFASVRGKGELALGNVIGANIVLMTIVMGIALVIGKKMVIKEHMAKRSLVTMFIVLILPIALGLDGKISFYDGLILIFSFVVYVFVMLQREGSFSHIKKQVKWENIWKDMFVFVGALTALLLGTRWLVISSLEVAKVMDLPVFVVGLILVGLGTTVPEIMVVTKSVLKGKESFSFGDSFGSAVVDASLVIGIAALINEITFEMTPFLIGSVFLFITSLLGMFLISRKQLTRKHGIVLLIIYGIYLTVVITWIM